MKTKCRKESSSLRSCRVLVINIHNFSGENIALGRPAVQSSTRVGGGEAERAVDGNADPDWISQTCTHTYGETPSHYVNLL